VSEYISVTAAKADDAAAAEAEARKAWAEDESFARIARNLRHFGIDRKLMRAGDLDLVRTDPSLLRNNHAELLDRVGFMQEVYDVHYPFVEPPRPLSAPERFGEGGRFFNAMGCLKCHVMGNMLPGPARNTDEFVQVYRLDGVNGEGDKAEAVLNGTPYPVGSVIDGHKLISAANVYNMTGDVTTTAVVEGPNVMGETEQINLKAASAPNLSLTHRRLRMGWVHSWMINPGLIQPGTKMPQNFPKGQSSYSSPVAFTLDYSARETLDEGKLTPELLAKFPAGTLSNRATIETAVMGEKWYLTEAADLYTIEMDSVLRLSDPSGAGPVEIKLAAPSKPSDDEFDDSGPEDPVAALDRRKIPDSVKATLAGKGVELPGNAVVVPVEPGKKWSIRTQAEFTIKNEGDRLDVYAGRVEFTGSGEEQIRLLVDYLYDAGTRGTRVPLTKSVVVPEAAADPNAVFEE
jgi:hypothetical protein